VYGESSTGYAGWFEGDAHITGNLTVDGTLTGYSETDPVFGASIASGITSGQVTDWDTAFGWGDHSSTGYDSTDDSWTGTGDVYMTSGNVGIGTTSPTHKLHVVGDINLPSNQWLRVGGAITVSGDSVNTFLDTNMGYIAFRSGFMEKMRMTSTGNVGIGTTSPEAPLEVAGLVYQTGLGYSTFFGYEAGAVDDGSSNYNSAVGYQALYFNTTGAQNNAFGASALYYNGTGNSNNAMGYLALYYNTSGHSNTAMGNIALFDITTGNNNTAIGDYTGIGITTGSYNTILGANVTGLAADLQNNIIIADGEGNRRINVDSSGNVGIGTTSPSETLTVDGTIESTSGGIKFPNGTVQTTAIAAGQQCAEGTCFAGYDIDGNIVCSNLITITYTIGDPGPAGGIVFYVYAGGLHGLEAAPADQSSGAEWGCYGTEITGADGTASGTGAQNTADILAGCAESGIAAEHADNYSLNGYDDWFLPSKDELDLLYQQKDVVGGFANDNYWSSTEYNSFNAWYQNFYNGNQNASGKNYTIRVRAVRAF
jgi:hypothetical protein